MAGWRRAVAAAGAISAEQIDERLEEDASGESAGDECDDEETGEWRHGDGCGTFSGAVPEDVAEDLEVVVETCAGGGGGDGEEGPLVGACGGAEGEEFAGEAGGEGDTCEGGGGDGDGEGEERGTLVEPVEGLEVVGAVGAVDDDEDGEGGEAHEEVACEVVGDDHARGETADGGVGTEGEEEEAGVGDGGVAEEPFEIGLGDGGEVTEHERGGGDGHEEGGGGSAELVGGEEGLEEPAGDSEACGFGADGEESGDRGRSALVDIGDPEVERYGGDLEGEGDEDEREGEEGGCLGGGGEGVGDACEGDLAGYAVEPCEAVDEEACGERAEDEVFHAGLEGSDIPAHVGDEDVEADGGEFEAEEDGGEVDGGGHPHHACADEEREAVEFADSGAATGAGAEFGEDRGVIETEDEDAGGGDEGEALVEEGEFVVAVEAPDAVGREPVGFDGEEEEEDDGDGGESGETDETLAACGGERLCEEQDEAEHDEGDFQIIGRHGRSWVSARRRR